ncbi:MAG: thioesterase family protein, partial [Planctomycetales bacterium]
MTAFHTTRRVEFVDTDAAGIIHFTAFYRYMEQAEHEFLRSLGLSVMHQRADGATVGWPRVFAECSFKAPAYFEDVLDVRIEVERRGARSLTMRYEFHRGEKLIAEGRMKTVCCVLRPGEPMQAMDIPPEYDELRVESRESRVESRESRVES